MVQRRYGEGALEAEAEERSKVQLCDLFEEIKEKAQQVSAQRRRAEVFPTTYGTWCFSNSTVPTLRNRVVLFLGL